MVIFILFIFWIFLLAKLLCTVDEWCSYLCLENSSKFPLARIKPFSVTSGLGGLSSKDSKIVFFRMSDIFKPNVSNKFAPEPPPSSVEILRRKTLELNRTILALFRSSSEEIVELVSESLSPDFRRDTISVFFTFLPFELIFGVSDSMWFSKFWRAGSRPSSEASNGIGSPDSKELRVDC